jgi:hypothetical protein
MAGSPVLFYHAAAQRLLDTDTFSTDDHRMALLAKTHVPDLSGDTAGSHVSAAGIVDADYAQKDMAGEAGTITSGVAKIAANDVNFGAAVTITAGFAVIVKGTVAGGAGTDKLVSIHALFLDTAKNPNVAAAVDKGSGKVGIPLTAHGYSTGDVLLITGTVNYDGYYAVDATSTANEIVITATFVAETFTGSETVEKVLDFSSTAGSFDVKFHATNRIALVDFTAKAQLQ